MSVSGTSFRIYARRWRGICVAAMLSVVLVSCSSLVAVVDYETELKVDDRTAHAHVDPSGLIIQTRKSTEEDTFVAAKKAKKVVWVVAAGGGLSGEVGNYGADTLCLELGDATVSSNFQPISTPLPVTVQRVVTAGKLTMTPPVSRGRVIVLSALCVAPGERTQYTLNMHRTAPSPTGLLFNAPTEIDTSTIVDAVKGNWVRVVVPYSLGSRKEKLVATFTATGAKAVRVSW